MPSEHSPKDPVSQWPERIYIQRDDDCAAEGCGVHHDTTWCADRINDGDVEYVRADLAAADQRLHATATALLRFRPGNRGPDGWVNFEGSDNEWDELSDAAWKELADAVEGSKS